MIDMHQHRQFIDRILTRYGLEPWRLEIVDDVRAWILAHGGEELNRERAARTVVHPDGGVYILVRAVQSDGLIASALSRMDLDWPPDEVKRLKSPEAYVAHLVLHEVAYAVLWNREQRPRDEWAFEELDACLALRP